MNTVTIIAVLGAFTVLLGTTFGAGIGLGKEASPEVEEYSGEVQPDEDEVKNVIDPRDKVKDDTELVDILKALDRASNDMTEQERDRLDDMIEDAEDCENKVSGKRQKRACGSCTVYCPNGACSCSGCCKCKCTLWGGRPKCKRTIWG